MNKLFVSAFAIALAFSTGASSQDRDLHITPVQQRTPVWCWLAVGEMIFEHYDVPDVNPAGIFQCGIVGVVALHGLANPVCNLDCGRCTEPAGTASRLTSMLELYPDVLQQEGLYDDGIEARHRRTALSKQTILDEIDDGNPVVAGISPGQNLGAFRGGAAHVALIVGYRDDGDTLLVNDPFPYTSFGNGWDPYVAAGGSAVRNLKYEIAFDDFRRDLNWSESWTVERIAGDNDGGDGGGGLARYCCTPVGKLGPYPPGIPAGRACYGTDPVFGTAVGRACY
ncbi:MAG: C39 family peptidase [Bauldia sp.]|nr:C39 family peptidase [Bauldia sp.]